MVALIQRENHAANKGKIAGRYQFDTHPTGIELKNIFKQYFLEFLKQFLTIKVEKLNLYTDSLQHPSIRRSILFLNISALCVMNIIELKNWL